MKSDQGWGSLTVRGRGLNPGGGARMEAEPAPECLAARPAGCKAKQQRRIRLPDAESVGWEPAGKALHGFWDRSWTCAAQSYLRDLPGSLEPVSRCEVGVGFLGRTAAVWAQGWAFSLRERAVSRVSWVPPVPPAPLAPVARPRLQGSSSGASKDLGGEFAFIPSKLFFPQRLHEV